MFNNVALDAVIGLVLIYLLYSMLISMIGEYLSTKLGLRARVLRVAIERMLNDGYYKKPHHKKNPRSVVAWLRGWGERNLLLESVYFKYSFAGRFYDYPSIKFLGRVDKDQKFIFALTKPSYITPANFADTLILMLKDQSLGTADLDRIGYTLQYNTQHIQPATLKNITNLFNNAHGDPGVFRQSLMDWFKETNDRATGWFKRKLTLILIVVGFLVASVANVDSIRISRMLSKDKQAREQLVNMGIRLSKDTVKYHNELNGKKDSIQGKSVIDSGFSHISKDLNAANLVLGIGWRYDTLFNTDQLELEPADSLYNYAFRQAARFNRAHDGLVTSQVAVAQKKRGLDSIVEKMGLDRVDMELFSSIADSVDLKKADLNRLLLRKKTLSMAISKDSLNIRKFLKSIGALQRPLLTDDFFWFSHIQLPGANKDSQHRQIVLTGKKKYSPAQKIGQYFLNSYHNFWGLLITALALSMGAPFWFNVLGKLVAIRSSGPKPDDPKDAATGNIGSGDGNGAGSDGNGGDDEDNPPADPNCQALDALTNQLKNENGIVNVWLNTKDPSLSVALINEATLTYIKNKYGSQFKASDSLSIAVNYEIQNAGTTFGANNNDGYRIKNPNGPNGTGTLGAFLSRTGSNTAYFISCWHVMKENHAWNVAIPDAFKTLTGSDDKSVGTVLFGALAPTYDAGVAITSLPNTTPQNQSVDGTFIIRSQHRLLTAFDEQNSTRVFICGRDSTVKTAKIFRINANPTLPYPDGKSYTMHGAFSLVRVTGGGCPTEDGDSGAVVIDSDGAPLGMIYGGNDNFAYAIKFSNLLNKNQPFYGYSFILNP